LREEIEYALKPSVFEGFHIRWASNRVPWTCFNFMHSFHQFVRNLLAVFSPTYYTLLKKKRYFCRKYFYWRKEIQVQALIKSYFSSFSGVQDRQTEVHDKALW